MIARRRAGLVAALCATLLPSLARADGSLWDELARPGRGRYHKLLVEAERLRIEGDTAAAEKIVVEATRLLPDDAAAWMALGDLRRRARDRAGTRAAFEQARRVAPDATDPTLAFDLGAARALDGDLEGSLVEYRRCEAAGAAAAPPAFEADLLAFNLGDVYMALGRLGDAIASYRRAVALSPRRALPQFALAVALDRDEQVAQSRAALELALAFDRDGKTLRSDDNFFVPQADRHYYLALAHLARGRLAAGRADLRAFLVELPHGPYAARARDRLLAIPDAVDPRELGGGGNYDRVALARALGLARADAERCLASGGRLAQLLVSAQGVTAHDLSPVEQGCLDRATATARRLLRSPMLVEWPVARPDP